MSWTALHDPVERAPASARPDESLRVLMIGPRVPPPTGQSIAFEVLLGAFGRYGKSEIIDLAERFGRRDRAFSVRRAWAVLKLSLRLWRGVRWSQAVYMQIAQSRWGLLRDCLFIAMARVVGRPVITHLHGGGYGDFYQSEPPLFRSVIRHGLAKVHRMIVLSDALRENFAFMGEAFAARIRVVPNPCPVKTTGPKPAPGGEVRLLFLSNLLVEKGYLDCVDALVHVQRLLPDVQVKLILAGAPLLGQDEYRDAADLEESLGKHIRYLGLENSVAIVGVVMNEAKLRLLADAHIALLPTYYRNEGQPIALIEAMASGLPFVATAWRGIRDLADCDAGIFVPPKSPLEIADAVVQLVRDPRRYERMSANAVAVSAQYAQELHIDRMMTILHDACRPLPENA
jgi:glycosyltransferase involved in cell wall biosynthesis